MVSAVKNVLTAYVGCYLSIKIEDRIYQKVDAVSKKNIYYVRLTGQTFSKAQKPDKSQEL